MDVVDVSAALGAIGVSVAIGEACGTTLDINSTTLFDVKKKVQLFGRTNTRQAR